MQLLNIVKKKWPLTSYLGHSFIEYILMNSVNPFHELVWPLCTTILQMLLCGASSFWKWSKVPEFGGKVRLVVYCRHSCADRSELWFMVILYAGFERDKERETRGKRGRKDRRKMLRVNMLLLYVALICCTDIEQQFFTNAVWAKMSPCPVLGNMNEGED